MLKCHLYTSFEAFNWPNFFKYSEVRAVSKTEKKGRKRRLNCEL
jgi:hypothetical protein